MKNRYQINFREFRIRLGISREVLSHLTDIPLERLRRYEIGTRTPTKPELKKIYGVLKQRAQEAISLTNVLNGECDE